jgi:LPXTG-site transpeptidase (sortase) family protein
VVVGIAALVVAVSTITRPSGGAHHRDAGTQLSTPEPRAPTLPRTSPTLTGAPHSPATGDAPTTATRHATPPTTNSARPAGAGAFRLAVQINSGEISADVSPMSVASNEPVDPPHSTAAQWNTAVWVQQSSYPSARSAGTSYVYGHACHHHVCSFTNLKDAELGDQVTVTTAASTLVYRIVRIGLSPKAATSLPSWASDSSVPNRVVLVTCAYERGDTSTDNLVVVANLQRS